MDGIITSINRPIRQPATAIYARISEDRQDGAGVDRQLEDCRSLVTRHGWGPAREFVDNNVSAFNGKPRPKYAEMLAAVESGDVDRIVTYNLDRLYRRPIELEQVIKLADEKRVSVITCNNGDLGLGDAESDGVFMARLLVNVANKSSRDTSRRVKRQKAQARANGQALGGPRPFGWINATTPDPGEAKLVSKAVDSLLRGTSLQQLAREWNAANVPQPQTHRANWTADGIRQVVSNPKHAGLVGHRAYQRDEDGRERFARPQVVAKASTPILVDPARWHRLQALLDQRGAFGKIPRRRSLLTGLVLCANCGSTMSRSGARGKADGPVRHVFRCPSPLKVKGEDGKVRVVARGCGKLSIDAAGLELWMTEATFKVAETTSLARVIQAKGAEGKQAERLVHDLEELRRREDAAAESYAAGRLPVHLFEKTSASILRSQRELQVQLSRLSTTTVMEPYAGRSGLLRKRWPELSMDQRRAVIAWALNKVRVTPAVVAGRPHFDPGRLELVPVGELRKNPVSPAP